MYSFFIVPDFAHTMEKETCIEDERSANKSTDVGREVFTTSAVEVGCKIEADFYQDKFNCSRNPL